MSKEVAGVALEALRTPVHDALRAYQALSDGSLQFDLDTAPDLELTPDKPNSARSVTDVQHLGETMGKLYVIAFAPHDGTGDESTYSLDGVYPDKGLPRHSKIVPRSKQGIDSELHFALAGQFTGIEGDPVPFAGNLDIIGFKDDGYIGAIGRAGLGLHAFVNALESGRAVEPTVSLTVGKDYVHEQRAGDPHAIYNAFGAVLQVAGFLAITDEMAAQHGSLVDELGARFRL